VFDANPDGAGALFTLTQSRDADGGLRLVFHGELDLSCIRRLDAALRSVDRSATVTLDLSDLEFADCAGLGCVIDWVGRAADQGWDLRIGPVTSSQVARLIDLLGVDHLLWPDAPEPEPPHSVSLP
jgi:anti-sigma B factor antagonist